jgi:hypothetical protein
MTRGYVILRNVLSDQKLKCGSTTEQKIDYTEMRHFIDTIFFPTIASNVDFITKPTYAKFRFSNNNNSTDASTFHSDVYNYTGSKIQPIFTCLCYFDDTQMELIPGTHLYDRNGYSRNTYAQKRVIDIRRGDILIFYASIHHRGTGFTNGRNRRLLQVFEVFPDDSIYSEHRDKLLIVQSSKTTLMPLVNQVSFYLSKNDTLQGVISAVHYFLMYNDLHYKLGLIDIPPSEKEGRYVSYEPGKRINFDNIAKQEDINVNIICDANISTTDCSNYYLYFYALYWIVSLAILYLIYDFMRIKSYVKPKTKLRSRNLYRFH